MKGYLSVISSIQSHSVLPEVFEERREDLCLNVVRFHTVRPAALLYHLPVTTQHVYSYAVKTSFNLQICTYKLEQLITFNTIFFISSSGDWNSRIRINITSLV